jgi:glycosyltransferase involved in cell wall biosynthesis
LRIAIVSDAWRPQINGVVHTIAKVVGVLTGRGHRVEVFGPERFTTIPCPTYPEIRLAIGPKEAMRKFLRDFRPDALHIVTEGPLGWAARSICLRWGWPFTTSYHTRFPEYVHARSGIPVSWTYAIMRKFHEHSAGMLVVTESIREELRKRGFRNKLVPWSRGIDLGLYHPAAERQDLDPRPIWLYVGRVAIEKNIEAFLKLDLPGTRWVVGGGPMLAPLRRKYTDARFFGSVGHEELAFRYAQADCFVFPSRTDTFGNVMIEALASGLPVAAFPVPGPIDVITDPALGRLNEDLRAACLDAVTLPDPMARQRRAATYSWQTCADQFYVNLAQIEEHRSQPADIKVPEQATA